MLSAVIKAKDNNSAIDRGILNRSTIHKQGGVRLPASQKGKLQKPPPSSFRNSAIQLSVIMLRLSPQPTMNLNNYLMKRMNYESLGC